MTFLYISDIRWLATAIVAGGSIHSASVSVSLSSSRLCTIDAFSSGIGLCFSTFFQRIGLRARISAYVGALVKTLYGILEGGMIVKAPGSS